MTVPGNEMIHQNPTQEEKKISGLGYHNIFLSFLGSCLSRSTTLVSALSIAAPVALLGLLLVNSCITLMERMNIQKD